MTFRERYSTILGYAAPIVLGLLVSLAGVAPWLVMARLNARIRPDIPWVALATLAWLALWLAWLNGLGPPGRWRAARRYRLRLWRADANGFAKERIGVTLALMALLGLLAILWILLGAPARPPDLSGYHSSAYLISVVVMGPLVSGVTEEAAFRGYMQRGLERYGPQTAILVSALVFALAHGTHGLGTLLLLGPGIFFAGIFYGMLAWHSGSIIPGMIVHFLGDLAFAWFAILGGDGRLLLVH